MAFFKNIKGALDGVAENIKEAVDGAAEVVGNKVVKNCRFENNTKYQVQVVHHDETYTLKPGQALSNWIISGFSVDLIMKFSDTKEHKINFPSTRYENRTHKMGMLFADQIRAHEMSLVKIVRGFSKWHLIFNHPGGYEEEVEIELLSKNSWKSMQETGGEIEAKVGGLIKAVELGLAAKASMKVTRVDEFERQTTEKRKRKFKDPCYLWQEIVVIKTNRESPFHELQIPTAHTEQTSTHADPGRNKFIYDAN